MNSPASAPPWALALAGLACVAAYVFPYFNLHGEWWRFAPSTIVIFGIGYLVAKRDAFRLFGLAMNQRDLATSLALFAVAALVARYVLTDYVGGFLEVHREMRLRSQAHQFFQVLNDELLLRAAALTVLLRFWRNRTAAIVVLALVFAALHFVFYATEGIAIEAATLLTFFAFGVVGNTLFVRFGHIGYPFALHYAWNFYRFNTVYALDGWRLREGDVSNLIEGNGWVAAGAFSLMLIVFGPYLSWDRKSSSARVS